MNTKQCTKCKEVKPLSAFSKDKNAKDGYQFWCKVCQSNYYNEHGDKLRKRSRARHKENRDEISRRKQIYYRENRDYIRERTRKNTIENYGISIEEYNEMLKLQGGVCTLCGMTPEENGKRLAIDHDHETGKVRELLCRRCNVALGLLDDNPKRCDVFKAYLQKHGK